MANNLPPGFVIEEPQTAAPVQDALATPPQPSVAAPQAAQAPVAGLPAGFEVEQPGAVDADTPWLDVLGEAAQNAPSSARAFGKDIATAVTNPRQTIEGLSGLFFGLIEKGLPDVGTEEAAQREEQADLVVSHFKNRFGSLEGFKRAVAKDPVGVLADASTVLIPTGAAVRGAGTVTKLSRLSKVGGAIQKAGAAIEPVQAVTKTLAKTFRLIPKVIKPEKVFQSAAKFSTVLPAPTRAKIIKVALDEKLRPTIAGVDKLRDQINLLGNQVTDLIDDATAAGKTIPTAALFGDLSKLRKSARLSTAGVGNIKKINKVMRDIKQASGKTLTVAEAQTLKQNIYKELGDVWTQTNKAKWVKDAQKSIALTSKELIEEIIPEVKALNAKQGVRLELAKELERAAARIDNRDLIGLGSASKATAGAAAGGIPGIVGGAAVGLLDFPKVKTQIAFLLDDLRKANPQFKPSQAAVSLGLTAPERIAE